jgi:hypothetical protein
MEKIRSHWNNTQYTNVNSDMLYNRNRQDWPEQQVENADEIDESKSWEVMAEQQNNAFLSLIVVIVMNRKYRGRALEMQRYRHSHQHRSIARRRRRRRRRRSIRSDKLSTIHRRPAGSSSMLANRIHSFRNATICIACFPRSCSSLLRFHSTILLRRHRRRRPLPIRHRRPLRMLIQIPRSLWKSVVAPVAVSSRWPRCAKTAVSSVAICRRAPSNSSRSIFDYL